MNLECSYIDITVRTSVSYKKERCLHQFSASVATSLLGLRCSEVLDYGSLRILPNGGCSWEKEECMTSPKVRLVASRNIQTHNNNLDKKLRELNPSCLLFLLSDCCVQIYM